VLDEEGRPVPPNRDGPWSSASRSPRHAAHVVATTSGFAPGTWNGIPDTS
jgi:hypothetical protein